ncbi:MAG TPA: glycosyltransferase family 87 protein [Gaiellaceae bacterium]|nr:glycosyltransferase family 87 protein [Gaiellaceae bacterium]
MVDRRALSLRAPAALRTPREIAAAVALVGLGLVLVVLYARRALSGWGAGPLPYDLMVFLDAADDVVGGRSPFPDVATLAGDQNYVYPPLLALVLIPLAVLPSALATFVWVAIGIAAVAGALWLLEVRDPWVYGVALLFPATRDAVGAGTVGPLLVLLLAVAWRYRDPRPPLPGLAVGLAVALKLFVWPVLAWLVATRRLAAAAGAVAAGAGAALLSWIVIGLDGLGDYPDLLRRLSELEADRSYSSVAVGRALGLGSTAAAIVAVALGVLCLVAVFRLARDRSMPPDERDRRSLTAAVAAALVLTPILWIHYLVLLLVPLALARPRFSPLWLVPALPLVPRLAGWEPAGWPEGDAASLAVVLGAAAVTLALLLRPPPRSHAR